MKYIILSFKPVFYVGKSFIFRQLTKFYSLDEYDITLCLPQEVKENKTGTELRNKVLPITDRMPLKGENIATFAYPKTSVHLESEIPSVHFNTSWYFGNLVDFHAKGWGFLKYPCFQTSIQILGGASGGPVLNSKGEIFAINSRSFDFGSDDEEPVSFVTPIAPLLDIEVEASPGQQLKIRDLAQLGVINLR